MKPKQLLNNSHPSPESGYTIIEGLVAMIMVAALMVAVAPVIVFSVGTRVNARRVELGAQAARSYIDWVRAANDATERANRSPDYSDISLDSGPSAPTGGSLDCPTSGAYCNTSPANQLYCVNGDETEGCDVNSLKDMIVQAVSFNNDASFYNVDPSDPSATTVNYQLGYDMLVRVYRADAFAPDVGTLNTSRPATTVTNGIGTRSSPLVTTTTEIAPVENSFKNIRNRLN